MNKVNLLQPINNELVHTFRPQFVFQGATDFGLCRYVIEVSATSDFLGAVFTYSQVDNVAEWPTPYQQSIHPMAFAPPAARIVFPDGKYYWRVYAYSFDCLVLLAESGVQSFVIEGATYQWKVGLEGNEVPFKPSNMSVDIRRIQYGRSYVEKRIIKVDFAHMNQAKRDELYAEFARAEVLKFHDNMGNIIDVYWGEVDRSLDGSGHPPDKPVFGINQSNMIAGAIRWNGTAIFSEG